jgi:glycosyltransferase involved in cell wall biosynthesis
MSDTPRRDWSTPRFLFVGNDFERKNGVAVVSAFKRLRDQVSEARLDVVGTPRRSISTG